MTGIGRSDSDSFNIIFATLPLQDTTKKAHLSNSSSSLLTFPHPYLLLVRPDTLIMNHPVPLTRLLIIPQQLLISFRCR